MDTVAFQEPCKIELPSAIKSENNLDILCDEFISDCKFISTILLVNEHILKEDSILCFCDHWFWLHIVCPLLELSQHQNTTQNGCVRAFTVTDSGLVACVLHACSATPPTGSYHWCMLSSSLWTLMTRVTCHFNLSVSDCKALFFHPSSVSEDNTLMSMAVTSDFSVIKRTQPVRNSFVSPSAGSCISGPDLLLPEEIVPWEFPVVWKTSDVAENVSWLMKLWSEEFGFPRLTAVGVNDDFIKEEFPVSLIKGESLEPSEALEAVTPIQYCQMPARNTICGSRKKGISLHELIIICEDYCNLFKVRKSKAHSPWRQFHWGGGSTLIECPACCKPFKGSASDMLDLCNHIKRRHKESQDLLLLSVCKDYSGKLEYMKDKIKKHAVCQYKNKLRCKQSPVSNS